MIILKVTKNQGFILSLEDVFFGKSQEGWGVKLTPLCIPLGGNIPLLANSVSILFISPERVGIF